MRATGFTCLAGALWGTVGIATQLMAEGGPGLAPEVSALSRTALGALVLLAAVPLFAPRRASGTEPWALVGLFGIAGAVFQVTLFASYPVVGVTVAVIVTACFPALLVACWDTLAARHPPGPLLAGTILIAGAGVVLAALGSGAPPSAARGGEASLAGLALVGTSGLAFAIVAIAGRALGARMHPLRAAAFGLAATATAIAAFCVSRLFADGATPAAVRAGLSPRDLVLLAYVGIVATGGAYLAFVAGLGRARSVTAGFAPMLVEPAVATMLAALILHERTTASAGIGCLMVVSATLAQSIGEGRWKPRQDRPIPSISEGEPL